MQIPNPSALLGNAALFELEIQGVPGVSRVVRFSGHEGVSAIFEFHIGLAGEDVDLRQIIGKPATLTIEGVELPRRLHGIISHVQYTGHSRRYTLYELTLVPPLWKLLHRTNCRVFQPADTPAILKKVFTDAGLDQKTIRFDLNASYGERNYCVQYRESDFAFVSRLMEEDGIFYFFEHDAEQTTLVIADHPGVHKPIPGIPLLWFNEGDHVRDREHITHMRFAETIRPGKISLRDFNFHTPDDPLDVDADAERDVDLEVYDYPGEYQEPSDGAPHMGSSMAKIRLESLQAGKRQGTGGSDCPRLTPGFTFTLTGHPNRSELNAGYILTRVVHHGSQPQVLDEDGQGSFHYSNDFVCIEEGVPFRPPRITPRPIVRGVQSAQVVGPDSEEVYTDDQGRVKVQFHWDREGEFNEDSSCWVRVSQLWAGAGWGAMFIPRIGHEVLIDFIEGDPDRPIITGRVYHGKNDIPYPLPDEKTKSTIKSNSSMGGGGFNELRFEDRKDAEQIFFHAQRNLDTCVRHDSMESVLNDKHVTVGGTSEEGKVGDFREQTFRDRQAIVHRDHDEHVGGDVRLHIGGIDGDGNADVVIEGVKKEHILKDAHLHIDADRREHVDGTYFLHVGNLHVLIDGNLHIKGPKLVVEATNTLSLKGGGSFIHLDGSGIAIEGKMVWLNSGKRTVNGDMDEGTEVADAVEAKPVDPTPAEGAS